MWKACVPEQIQSLYRQAGVVCWSKSRCSLSVLKQVSSLDPGGAGPSRLGSKPHGLLAFFFLTLKIQVYSSVTPWIRPDAPGTGWWLNPDAIKRFTAAPTERSLLYAEPWRQSLNPACHKLTWVTIMCCVFTRKEEYNTIRSFLAWTECLVSCPTVF